MVRTHLVFAMFHISDLELLSIKCRPHFRQREFTSVIIKAVYIPVRVQRLPSGIFAKTWTTHKPIILMVRSLFLETSIRLTLRRLCLHCYTSFKNSYRVESLPVFRKSDNVAILLRSKYVNKLWHMPPVTWEVRKWSGQSEVALQSALHDAAWSMFQDHRWHHWWHQRIHWVCGGFNL